MGCNRDQNPLTGKRLAPHVPQLPQHPDPSAGAVRADGPEPCTGVRMRADHLRLSPHRELQDVRGLRPPSPVHEVAGLRRALRPEPHRRRRQDHRRRRGQGCESQRIHRALWRGVPRRWPDSGDPARGQLSPCHRVRGGDGPVHPGADGEGVGLHDGGRLGLLRHLRVPRLRKALQDGCGCGSVRGAGGVGRLREGRCPGLRPLEGCQAAGCGGRRRVGRAVGDRGGISNAR